MNTKTFYQNLRRGLGSAVIEIKENPDSSKYRDIVLRCCLHDITFDWQSDGTRGYYLYTAICALDEKDYFEPILIDRFLKRCSDGLLRQLSSILANYCDDGSALSKDAFRHKYDYFASRHGKLFKNCDKNFDESFQWDVVAVDLFYIDKFAAFKRYAQDAGESLQKNPDNRNVHYDSAQRKLPQIRR